MKHILRTDTSPFLTLLRAGDLVEFEREGYQHWAVYIGDVTCHHFTMAIMC